MDVTSNLNIVNKNLSVSLRQTICTPVLNKVLFKRMSSNQLPYYRKFTLVLIKVFEINAT